MPTIEISDETRNLLRAFADDENEADEIVLKRVLTRLKQDHDAALRAYEESDQDVSSTN